MFKKVLAVIVIVISAILLLASLAGIGGVWVVRSEVGAVVDQVVLVADTALTRAQDRSGQISAQIDQSLATIGTMTTKINTIGDNAQETNLLVVALEQALDTDLGPTIEQLTQTAGDLQSKVAALDSTINTLNRMPPFRSNQNDVLDKASRVIDGLAQARQSVLDLRQALKDKKEAITQKTVMIITSPLNRLGNMLKTAQQTVNDLQKTLGDIQAWLVSFQSAVWTALTVTAAVTTLLLLWMGLGQAGLILLSVSVFTGKDLFTSWRVSSSDTLSLDEPPGQDSTPAVEEAVSESEETDTTEISS